VKRAALALAELVQAGHSLIVTHGNGPQIGLLALQAAAGPSDGVYPLDVLGAESEGMIGYLIEQELGHLLPGKIFRNAADADKSRRRRSGFWPTNKAHRPHLRRADGSSHSSRARLERCPRRIRMAARRGVAQADRNHGSACHLHVGGPTSHRYLRWRRGAFQS
jgi:hypothetical protein